MSKLDVFDKYKALWCKKENDIWFIGNIDKTAAKLEKRHSIHQIIAKI